MIYDLQDSGSWNFCVARLSFHKSKLEAAGSPKHTPHMVHLATVWGLFHAPAAAAPGISLHIIAHRLPSSPRGSCTPASSPATAGAFPPSSALGRLAGLLSAPVPAAPVSASTVHPPCCVLHSCPAPLSAANSALVSTCMRAHDPQPLEMTFATDKHSGYTTRDKALSIHWNSATH